MTDATEKHAALTGQGQSFGKQAWYAILALCVFCLVLFFNLFSKFPLKEFSHITATKLSERHHHCFLFIPWVKLPLLPQMRCPNRNPRKNRQFLLTDPQVFTKASDQGWRKAGFFNLLRGRLQWYLPLFQLILLLGCKSC